MSCVFYLLITQTQSNGHSNESLSLQRSRSCCETPNLLRPEVVEKCLAQVLDDKDSPIDMAYEITLEDYMFAPGIRCISNCILNTTNFYMALRQNDTYAIDTSALELIFDRHFNGSAVWAPVLEQAVQTCVKAVGQTHFDDDADDECPPLGAFFFFCLDTKMFQLCPADVWQNGEASGFSWREIEGNVVFFCIYVSAV